MNAVMDSYWEQYLDRYPQDFTITPEKLEEMKQKMPKAGPKYRLGMYFETIHGLTEFEEATCPPEDGYSSCWETDTELDSEIGNLIFHNVTGDSASVICIDEAMDLLALREQQQYMDTRRDLHSGPLHQIAEHPLERSDDSKRSATSRHSHHSGSDGTYEGPQPEPSPTHSARPCSAQEHIYETLDDYQVNYGGNMNGFYGSKSASEGSRGSSGSTAKDDDVLLASRQSPPKLPPYRGLTKHRSFSAPQPPEGLKLRHRRKLSETEYPKKRKQHCGNERSDSVAPLKPFALPAKGYSTFPRGLPSEYAECMAVPPSPTKKCAGLTQEEGKKARRPPSLIIKHKGKTYLIPVVDKKVKDKWDKSKPEEAQSRFRATPVPSVAFSTQPKHATLNTNVSRSTGSGASVYQTEVPIQSRRHSSPTGTRPRLVIDTDDQAAAAAPASKKKGRQAQQNTTPTTPKQVTHYGVV